MELPCLTLFDSSLDSLDNRLLANQDLFAAAMDAFGIQNSDRVRYGGATGTHVHVFWLFRCRLKL